MGRDGAEVVIDLLGNRHSLSWGLQALGPAGRLLVLTTFRAVEFPVSPRDTVFRQKSILGSRYASRSEIDLAAQMVEVGRIQPVVSRVVGIRDVESIHEDLRKGHVLGRGAVTLSA